MLLNYVEAQGSQIPILSICHAKHRDLISAKVYVEHASSKRDYWVLLPQMQELWM